MEMARENPDDLVPREFGVGPESLDMFPPGVLERWLYIGAVSCCVFVVLATVGVCKFKRLLIYWENEGSQLVREYLQKMAVYHIVVLALLYIIVYQSYFDRFEISRSDLHCLEVVDHKFLLLCIVVGSLGAGLVRYLAIGFGHSEQFTFGGHLYKNHYNGNVRPGFYAHSNVPYKRVLGPYVKMSAVVTILTVVFLYVPLYAELQDRVLRQPLCLDRWSNPSDPGSTEDSTIHLLWLTILLLLPVFTVLGIEHCCHVVTEGYFTKVPGYLVILNAPFVTVTLTTTWALWLVVFALSMWLFSGDGDGGGSGELFSLLALVYTCLDSLWLLFMSLIAGRQSGRTLRI